MNKFEYFHGFESILYGLAVAHVLVGISDMIQHRKSIKLYWGHIIGIAIIILAIVQNYYRLFYFTEEYTNTAWLFFFFRVVPLSLLFIITYQVFPKKTKGTDFEEFVHSHEKEILVPIVLFNLIGVFKTAWFRLEEFKALSDGGNVWFSYQLWLYLMPLLFFTSLPLIIIFYYRKKIAIQVLIILSLIYFLVAITLSTDGSI